MGSFATSNALIPTPPHHFTNFRPKWKFDLLRVLITVLYQADVTKSGQDKRNVNDKIIDQTKILK